MSDTAVTSAPRLAATVPSDATVAPRPRRDIDLYAEGNSFAEPEDTDTQLKALFGDDGFDFKDLLDIVNPAGTPVDPSTPFVFDTPREATNTTVMEGAPRAVSAGRRVSVQGPFPPGNTFISVAFAMPAKTGQIRIEQPFPAALEHLGVIVQKVGEPRVISPQVERQQEMPVAERMYIAAAGGPIPVGQPLQLTIVGLPHHSQTPRLVAVTLTGVVLLTGLWFAWRPAPSVNAAGERKRLLARLGANTGCDTIGDFEPSISTGLGLPQWTNHIAFDAPTLDDLASARQRWQDNGYYVYEIDHGWCTSIYTEDPNGIMVEFCVLTATFGDADKKAALELLEDSNPTAQSGFAGRKFYKAADYAAR